MDKKTEYFIKKIERAINDGNYTDAKIYYDKAILYLGQIPEVIAYKSTIDSEIKRTKPNNQGSEDISGIRKRKPINEALIILPIMALVIIGYLFFYKYISHASYNQRTIAYMVSRRSLQQ